MTLNELRKELPNYHWMAERNGFGWNYRGRNADGKEVRVYAVAVLSGPSDDDFVTEWRVDNGKSSQNYAAFWCDAQAPF